MFYDFIMNSLNVIRQKCNIENKTEINTKSSELITYIHGKLKKVDSICVLQSNFINFNENLLNKKITLNSKIEISLL